MSAPVIIKLIDARETVLQSATKDAISFGGLIGTAWFLNTQIEPSGWLNAALGISWILWMAGKGTITKHTPQSAREKIDELDVLRPAQVRA